MFWHPREEGDTDNNSSHDYPEVFDPFQVETPTGPIFPKDPVDSLMRRRSRDRATFLLRHQKEMNIALARPPIVGGMVRNLDLVGTFPTRRWLYDSTMPDDVKELFGGTPLFALGEYRVAHFDLLDASRRTHSLTMIVNEGAEGFYTGYWGGVFSRAAPQDCWASFETTGERETTVTANPSVTNVFQEFRCLDHSENHFKGGFKPGKCTTQLERIFGSTAEFLLDLEWNEWLPGSLLERLDQSYRFERKRQARVARETWIESDYASYDDNDMIASQTKKSPLCSRPLRDVSYLANSRRVPSTGKASKNCEGEPR